MYAETIEKIAEMVSVGSKEMEQNILKTKKPLQILMSRNHTLQNDAIAKGSREGNVNLEINTDIGHKQIDPNNKMRKSATGSPTKTKDMPEDKFVEESRFEEVEGKLEEMFAGIEDEQLVNPPTDDKNMPKILSDCNGTNTDNKTELSTGNYPSISSLPTKAAQKSTTLVSSTESNKQINLPFHDYNNSSTPKSMLYLKTMPPRRRLSIGLNKELLKYSLKTSDKMQTEEEDMSEIPFNLKINGHVKRINKNVSKSKTNNSNQKNGSKYRREISYINSNNSGNKKTNRKSEAPIKDKQNRLKLKQTRIQRLLSSENDTEEKQLQTKEIETKNRSPFILVKNNGTVTVVNTVSPDDSNEKLTRPKKANNYVYERKTVKGCYSSTLGNRYDAETADSSWKCVFCKIGPHKKGLGDLFGPYIISSNCEEYRSTKDYFEKFRRNDVELLNFSHKSGNKLSNSHIQNITNSNSELLINTYTSGMSQLSVDCYEIWVHEDCAIWAPNIYVVGPKLTGLEEATWNSTRYECTYCLKQGALLCCLQRECKTTSHVPCAREFKWLLDESKFWVYCSKHALKKLYNKN